MTTTPYQRSSEIRIRCRMHKQHGFTLIEILAVIVIMGMLFAVTARGLRSMNGDAHTDIHTVLAFDQSMRSAARSHGPLTVDVHGLRMDVQGTDFHREWQLPIGVRFRDRTGRTLTQWAYDACGRSIDIEIRMANTHRNSEQASHTAVQSIHILGLSGAYINTHEHRRDDASDDGEPNE